MFKFIGTVVDCILYMIVSTWLIVFDLDEPFENDTEEVRNCLRFWIWLSLFAPLVYICYRVS